VNFKVILLVTEFTKFLCVSCFSISEFYDIVKYMNLQMQFQNFPFQICAMYNMCLYPDIMGF
jgi:hypothetical protein